MPSTKQKITIGYSLLLAILLCSLVFVYHEMENLSTADDMQNLKTDSLLLLLREKDQNTIQMLRVLNEANENSLSVSEIGEIISKQDSLMTKQRIQNRVITKRDSLITSPKRKGFFKRVAEVFAPSTKDTAMLINTSLEIATDTIIEPSSASDSLQRKIRKASQEKHSQKKKVVRRNNVAFQRMNSDLTNRVDSLIKDYEKEMSLRTLQETEFQHAVRMRSARIIGGIAVGAVLLSAFFLILILRDITKSTRYRKQLEEANKRAEELLVAREKLMLAITHDFKAPLSSIMGYTELLSQLTEDEQRRFYLDNMKGSSRHLLRLVNDLLDFHRLDLNKAEVNNVSFTPRRLFEEISVSFQPLMATKGLDLVCQIAPELSLCYVSDPLRIQQIVNNLLSNAVKFTQKGSVMLQASYTTSRLIINVTDTGKGMEPDDKERIFREFTRLPGAQGEEGFGLGLSIVHKLVHLLQGSIDVQSVLGEGSCFTVIIPLHPASCEEMEKQDLTTEEMETLTLVAPQNEKEHLCVLLIDDDKIQLDLTAAMLKHQGMTAVCCNQLEELTEQLRMSTFDVLLTDIQMPAINGFDLVKLLRVSNIPQANTIPVIAVTARSDMDDSTFRKHGFAGCLHKPFTVKELLNTVKSHRKLHFSALTAFSEGDPDAANAILRTFVEETEKNADQMKQAMETQDVEGIAAMAHKMLPLFTLIEASDVVPLLSWLEVERGNSYSEEVGKKVTIALSFIREISMEAQQSLSE